MEQSSGRDARDDVPNIRPVDQGWWRVSDDSGSFRRRCDDGV
jgi:hypothetical protein